MTNNKSGYNKSPFQQKVCCRRSRLSALHPLSQRLASVFVQTLHFSVSSDFLCHRVTVKCNSTPCDSKSELFLDLAPLTLGSSKKLFSLFPACPHLPGLPHGSFFFFKNKTRKNSLLFASAVHDLKPYYNLKFALKTFLQNCGVSNVLH